MGVAVFSNPMLPCLYEPDSFTDPSFDGHRNLDNSIVFKINYTLVSNCLGNLM